MWFKKVDETGAIEIMYLLDPEHWRNGYALEAAEASIKYAIETLNVTRIIARVKVANESSKNFYESSGLYILMKLIIAGVYYHILNFIHHPKNSRHFICFLLLKIKLLLKFQ